MAKSDLPPSKPPAVFAYAQIAWDDRMRAKSAASSPKELIEKAKSSGARRKRIMQGEGGFFMNRSVLPAGFRVPPHHHTHDEILVILKGSCQCARLDRQLSHLAMHSVHPSAYFRGDPFELRRRRRATKLGRVAIDVENPAQDFLPPLEIVEFELTRDNRVAPSHHRVDAGRISARAREKRGQARCVAVFTRRRHAE